MRIRTYVAFSTLLTLSVISAATHQTASATANPEPRIVAVPFNNPLASKAAGFPSTALNVNRDQFGRLSWMMTPREIAAKKSFESRYLEPARKKVAASLLEGAPRTSASLFGLHGTSTFVVSGLAVQPENQAVVYDRDVQAGTITCGVGVLEDDFAAQVDLPSGARLTGMTVYGSDTSLLNDPTFTVYQYCNTGSGPQQVSIPLSATVTNGYSGGAFAVASEQVAHTVDNSDCVYSFVADFASTLTCDAGTGLHLAALHYKRQISPAPATQTFTDVAPGHQFFPEIEALAASGITGGCSAGQYCPDAPLTRGQMAAFLARALGLHWGDN